MSSESSQPALRPLTRIQRIVTWIDRRRFRLGCGGAILIIVAMSIAMMLGAMNALKDFPLYKAAAEAIVTDPLVQQELGTPISHRISLTDRAQIEINGQTGKARFHLILSGSKQHADGYVRAKLIGDDWKYQQISVVLANRLEPIEINVDQLETVSVEQIEAINTPDPALQSDNTPQESD